MSLRPPRRLFRGSPRSAGGASGRLPFAVWLGMVGGTIGVLVVLLGAPASLFGRVPPLTGVVRGGPEQVAVVDGETLVLNAMIVRLDGVSAPARGQVCGDVARDCGAEAAAALAALVRGREVSCRLSGRDGEGFARGVCEVAGQELNRAQVAGGWAKARADMPGLAAEEAAARGAGHGLWRSGGF